MVRLHEAEGLPGGVPVALSLGVDGNTDAAHVGHEAGVVALLEGLLDIGSALGAEIPRAAAEVVLVVVDEGEDLVLLVIGGVLADAGNLARELRDGVSVLEVELEHLHVRGTLAGTAGGDVVLESVLDGLESRERDDTGHLSRVVDAVLLHSLY